MAAVEALAVTRQFVCFGLIGVIGFLVDAGALTAFEALFGDQPYSGRVVSYLLAATTTWFLNRNFTFAGRARRQWLGEWARFVAANLGGGAVNLAIYTALVATLPLYRTHLVLAVAAGSAGGLMINFTASRLLVFTRP